MSRLQGDSPRLRSTYLTGAAVLGLVSAPLGALMVVTAPEIVLVVLGPKWGPAVLPFQILTAAIMLRNVYLMAYCLDGATGELKKRTFRDGIYAFAVVVGSLIGSRFGLIGVAIGVVSAIALNYFIGAWMSLGIIRATWRDYARSQIPALALGAVTAGVAVLVRLALLRVGADPLIVLGLTGLVSVGAIGGLYLLQPTILGEYGGLAVQHLLSALSSKVPTGEAG
jgi:PST family polysaccharide transporter